MMCKVKIYHAIIASRGFVSPDKLRRKTMSAYKIITDSCCDLTKAQYEALNVTYVPLTLLYKGESHDSFTVANGKIVTEPNKSGGILGGITSGMPLIFSAAIKATPSIAVTQQTVDLQTNQVTPLNIKGRHDPCIVPRAVPVIEAAVAIAIYDMILGNTQTNRRKV